MIVYLEDETNGLLNLFPDFFEILSAHVDGIVFREPEAYGFILRQVQNKYPGIRIMRDRENKGERKLTIRAVKELNHIDVREDDVIYFPIVPAERSNDADLSAVLVPIDSRHRVFGYVAGEMASFEDFIKRHKLIPDLKGKKVLVSAGPTAEDLDPVRYLTNRSTGKMGIALARAAFVRGGQVQLVLGPTTQQPPLYLKTIRVRSAEQMTDAILEQFPWCDVYVAAAAVADFTPEKTHIRKIKKSDRDIQLKLKRTTDIIKTVAERKSDQLLIGFSVETDAVIQNSLKKMRQKKMDMIVVNNPKEPGAGFATDTNRVTIIHSSGWKEDLPLMPKESVAHHIWDRAMHLLTDSNTKILKTGKSS